MPCFSALAGKPPSETTPGGRISSPFPKLLSSEDLAAARRSTLDAHYTAIDVVSAMWSGIQASGLLGNGKRAVLEPSMGTGLFLAAAPEDLLRQGTLTGVELDPRTAEISRHLYPSATIRQEAFQKSPDWNGYYDLVIGNPPFGDQRVIDAEHPEWSDAAPNIHSYFLWKSLHQVQPGGAVQVVVSRYFLDARAAEYEEFRKEFAREAELLDAVRLPRTAFQKNAGTQVVTDILFFRRRETPLSEAEMDQEIAGGNLDWIFGNGVIGTDSKTGQDVPGNRYYATRPDHLLGTPALIRGMYEENEPAILPDPESPNLGERIREHYAQAFPDPLPWPESRLAGQEEEGDPLHPVPEALSLSFPPGSFFLVDADEKVARERQVEDKPRLAIRVTGYPFFVWADEQTRQTEEGEEEERSPLEAEEEQGAKSLPAAKPKYNQSQLERITGMVRIRDRFLTLLNAQRNPEESDASVEAVRAGLNEVYDDFVARFGALRRPFNVRLFRDDAYAGNLLALEKDYTAEISAAVARRTGEERRPESAEKAEVFFRRTQYPTVIVDKAENPLDALRLCLSQTGKVDEKFILHALRESDVRDQPWEEIRKSLGDEILWHPDRNRYEQREQVLSGDVVTLLGSAKSKMETSEAEEDWSRLEELRRTASLLESVQPKRVPMEDIVVRFGSHWVPGGILGRFLKEKMGAESVNLRYIDVTAQWEVKNVVFSLPAESRWSDGQHFNASWLLKQTLNDKPLVVRERMSDRETIVLETASEIARQKSRELLMEWDQWVHSDEQCRETLENIYNERFNRWRKAQYDGSHLALPGSSATVSLRPSQKNVVWRGLQSGRLFMDHTVGAGKTFAAIALVMEARRLGVAQKPLVVVPNHLVEQWQSAFLSLYPSANLLVATKKDQQAKNRKSFYGKIAANSDWDAIIVPHSLFSLMETDPEQEAIVVGEEIAKMEAAIREMDAAKSDRRSIKKVERRVEKAKERIERKMERRGLQKDLGMHMGEMGIDYLVVDEVQEFKNLAYTTELKNIAGLGNPEGSGKAMDLFIKARSIQVMREDGGGVVYLTGTPLSNTIAEMYTWQRHMASERLEKMGIDHFDAWARLFAQTTREYAFTMTGDYKEKAYLAPFFNLPELRSINSYMDSISIEDVQQLMVDAGMPPVPVPKPEVHIVKVEPSVEQQAIIGTEIDEKEDGTPIYTPGSILDRLSRLPRKPKKGEDNILSLSGLMMRVGLDARAVTKENNDLPPEENGSKLPAVVKEIVKEWETWSDWRGTQLVFLDFSTPSGKGKKASEQDKKIAEFVETARLFEDAVEQEGFADDTLQAKADDAQEFLDRFSPDEVQEACDRVAGVRRWSAYEELRKMLVESGIPEKEIAFIHDYEKPEEKEALFAMVRSGMIRVLMGSSGKMGAGMNVQDRLTALHHLDAPYRPLDIEQRNGRGLRQGNKIHEALGDDFRVKVNYYVTEGAGDAGRWQILESKQKFIEQYRKEGSRTADDPTSKALDPAIVKAEASGSDVIINKVRADDTVKQLEVERRAWMTSLQNLRYEQQSADRNLAHLARFQKTVQDAIPAARTWLDDVQKAKTELLEKAAKKEIGATEKSEPSLLAPDEKTAEEEKNQKFGPYTFLVPDGNGWKVMKKQRISDLGAAVLSGIRENVDLADMRSALSEKHLLRIGFAEDAGFLELRCDGVSVKKPTYIADLSLVDDQGREITNMRIDGMIDEDLAAKGQTDIHRLVNVGRRVERAVEGILTLPGELPKKIATLSEKKKGIEQEIARMQSLSQGSDRFPKEHRLRFAQSFQQVLDAALKGGLRKSADLEKRMDALASLLEQAKTDADKEKLQGKLDRLWEAMGPITWLREHPGFMESLGKELPDSLFAQQLQEAFSATEMPNQRDRERNASHVSPGSERLASC